jgi:metacaspase-1
VLQGCHKDVTAIGLLAAKMGFDTVENHYDEQVTVAGFVEKMRDYSFKMVSGDLLWVHYSGHGASVPCEKGYESGEIDGRNEAWALYDGLFLDDELARTLKFFRAGVQVIITSDSCHSGTMTRNASAQGRVKSVPPSVVKRAEVMRYFSRDARMVKSVFIGCNVVAISGCKDDEYSYDTPDGGAFSTALRKKWWSINKKDDYFKLTARLVTALKGQQTPQLTWEGDDRQVHVKPFTSPLKVL